jgi:hypothetical protein
MMVWLQSQTAGPGAGHPLPPEGSNKMCFKGEYCKEETLKNQCNVFLGGKDIMLRTIKTIDLSDLEVGHFPDYEIQYSLVSITSAQARKLARELLDAVDEMERPVVRQNCEGLKTTE